MIGFDPARPDPDAFAPGLDQPQGGADRRPDPRAPARDDRQELASRASAVAPRRARRLHRRVRLDRTRNAGADARHRLDGRQPELVPWPSGDSRAPRCPMVRAIRCGLRSITAICSPSISASPMPPANRSSFAPSASSAAPTSRTTRTAGPTMSVRSASSAARPTTTSTGRTLDEDGSRGIRRASGWLGFTDKYWLTALAPGDAAMAADFRRSPSGGYQADYALAHGRRRSRPDSDDADAAVRRRQGEGTGSTAMRTRACPSSPSRSTGAGSNGSCGRSSTC